MTGSALSSSIQSRRASRELALAAALVEERPFSAMALTVILRVLETKNQIHRTSI
jgi:hypothetical protein